MKTKKSEITWEAIAKILLALLFLVFMIIAIYFYKDKIINLIYTMRDYARYR